VGIFGFGDDDKKKPGQALAEAEKAPSGASAMVVNLIQPLLDVGIDGKGPLPSAQSVADSARTKSAGVEQAIDRVVRAHLAVAGTGGFVTGLGGFVTMPVALPANIVEFYLVATRMTGAIAALRGYDLTDPPIRTAVLLALVGADADDLIRKAGIVTPTGKLTDLAAQRLPGPALMVLNKAVAFRLVGNVGRLQGGLLVLPDAQPDDGVIDVGVLEPRHWYDWPTLVARILVRRPASGPQAEILRGRRIEISCDRSVPVEFDGEDAGDATAMSVHVLAGAIVLCGAPS